MATRPVLAGVLAVCAALVPAQAAERPSPPRSGIEFASEDVRRMQADGFANPGMLWVERGEQLWRSPAGAKGQSCASCHGDGAKMRGVATRYPALDPGGAGLVNLDARVNLCRTRHQGTTPLAPESGDLLALTAFIGHQSHGLPTQVVVDGPAKPHFERGAAHYTRRIGQMNLACTHCHDRNAGRTLLSQTISQGHGNAYPAYRLEWQGIGSLARRLRACYFGVRAEVPDYGAAELIELELYLAWRGTGLAVETPGVRR